MRDQELRDRRGAAERLARGALATLIGAAMLGVAGAAAAQPTTPEVDRGAEPSEPAPSQRDLIEEFRSGAQTDAAEEIEEEPAPKLSPEEALEQAYADLKSEEEPIWRAAEEKVTKSWSQSGSDSMDLLLERGRTAMQREDWAAATEHLTDLVNLAPAFAEGWNMRASAYFHQEETGAALADLANAIALEPRHFSAYSGLGVLFEQIGDPRRALAAHREALAIHPNLENSLNAVRRLAPTADGRPI
ncbi:MAG: hypothetical protein AAGM38_07175 [Pseudomonadota bacterium]